MEEVSDDRPPAGARRKLDWGFLEESQAEESEKYCGESGDSKSDEIHEMGFDVLEFEFEFESFF